MTTSSPTVLSAEQAQAAAAALAAVLPVPAAVTPGAVVPAARADVTLLPPGFAAAVVAQLGETPGSAVAGELAIAVGADLTDALAASPLGALDLAAALQPAVEAVAGAVGAVASPGARFDGTSGLTGLMGRADAQLVTLVAADGRVVATLLLAVETAAAADFAEAPVPAAAAPAEGAAPGEGRTIPSQPLPAGQIPRQVGIAAPGGTALADRAGLDLLRDVVMEVTVELGRTRMTIHELLSLAPGTVVELDRAAGSAADLLVNGTLIARGEVVVVDEDFGIRITEIVGPVAP